MEQQELKKKDLLPYIGSKSKVSGVLAKKRFLSLSMIWKLHDDLGIPFEILLGDESIVLGMVAEEQPSYQIKKDGQ